MIFKKQLPTWLYEALPFLYISGGLVTFALLGSPLGFASGGLLISAGAAVWHMRWVYRRSLARAIVEGRSLPPSGPTEGLPRLLWRSAYESGHRVLDAQHQRLFVLGNELAAAAGAGNSAPQMLFLLEEIEDHILRHFATEESLLEKAGHPRLAEHKEYHRRLLARTRILGEGYRRGDVRAGDLVDFIADELVGSHVANEDLSLVSPPACSADAVKGRTMNMGPLVTH